MKLVTLKVPLTVDISSNDIRIKIYVVIKESWRQIKKLAWLFAHTPGFSEQHLLDEYLGPEIRRMKW